MEHVRRRDKRVEQYKVLSIIFVLGKKLKFLKKVLEEKAFLAQQKIKEKKEAERLKRIE